MRRLGEPPRFTRDAAALIHDRSGGVPRIINVICDAALIFGYAEEQRLLDRALLTVVVEELESTGILLPQGGSVRGCSARCGRRQGGGRCAAVCGAPGTGLV